MAKDATLLPAYLIVGDDLLKHRKVLERLRARISELGDIEFNSDVIDGQDASGGFIVDACNTLPFASERRYVLVRNADKLKKADSEALVKYLGAPCETTVLALECEKMAKSTRLYKAVLALGKTAVIDCSTPKDMAGRLREMAVARGIVLSPGAAQLMLSLVGEDTMQLDVELQKLASAHGSNQPVSEGEVEALIARTAEIKPWTFTDAFSDRDVARTLSTLRQLSTSPYALLPMCTKRIREIIMYRTLAGNGMTADFPKASGVSSPWQIKRYPGWARKWPEADLEKAIILARDAEKAMKSGDDPDSAFLRWILAVL